MRPGFYSLRTGILFNLTFLIIAAMLLINVVMLKFLERDLLEAKVETGKLLIHALNQSMGHQLARKNIEFGELGTDPQFKRETVQLLETGGFSETVIITHGAEPIFASDSTESEQAEGLSMAREAMATGDWSVDFSGSIWGVIWLDSRDLWISAPIVYKGRTLGGIAIGASLRPIYQGILKSERLILFYITLDTIILVIVGMYLLSRLVIRPVHKLLKMTEEYKEGDISPVFEEASPNEIGNLSRSLSLMLKRLDENKKQLRAHITSLEKANEELRHAQTEIIRSEKLASVGRLAAGIAHEIGNPTGIILGYLDLIKKADVNEADKEDFLNRIESEMTRINQIIRQLLDFSRPSNGKPQKTRAHKLIKDTLDILKPQPTVEDIQINLDLVASSDTVFVDPGQLQQVFLNIMMNAVDAFDGGDTREGEVSSKELTIRSENADHRIELRFMDNGPGIPEEELPHIFDPFHSTKEPGKGTGLGLSVCYRIVEGLGGAIRAESAIGKGTTIYITLPLCGDGN